MTWEIIKRDNIALVRTCQENCQPAVSILKFFPAIQDLLPRLPLVRHNPARSQFGFGAGGFFERTSVEFYCTARRIPAVYFY